MEDVDEAAVVQQRSNHVLVGRERCEEPQDVLGVGRRAAQQRQQVGHRVHIGAEGLDALG